MKVELWWINMLRCSWQSIHLRLESKWIRSWLLYTILAFELSGILILFQLKVSRKLIELNFCISRMLHISWLIQNEICSKKSLVLVTDQLYKTNLTLRHWMTLLDQVWIQSKREVTKLKITFTLAPWTANKAKIFVLLPRISKEHIFILECINLN
jgi:hypothetical protein